MDTEVAKDAATKIPTWPNLDPGVWSAVEVLLWALLALTLYFAFRVSIRDLVTALVIRARAGAALKFGPLEFGQIRVTPSAVPSSGLIKVLHDSGEWNRRRDSTYAEYRNVFLAHRLFPSELPGQLYDILVYLVPHKDRGGSQNGITRVQYYFGAAWGAQVFEARDAGKRFGIVVSAFGSGFLCTARVFFLRDDGTEEWFETWRYIDFEMGPLGEGGTTGQRDAP